MTFSASAENHAKDDMLVHSPGLGSQISRSSSWSPSGSSYGTGHAQAESGSGYLSTVFNSAKQRASALRWPQLDASQFRNPLAKSLVSTTPPPEFVITTAAAVSDLSVKEVDELPLSSQIGDDQLHLSTTANQTLPNDDFFVSSETFEKFKTDQEAKLKEWLEDTENHGRRSAAR